jgi:hypothetical protein
MPIREPDRQDQLLIGDVEDIVEELLPLVHGEVRGALMDRPQEINILLPHHLLEQQIPTPSLKLKVLLVEDRLFLLIILKIKLLALLVLFPTRDDSEVLLLVVDVEATDGEVAEELVMAVDRITEDTLPLVEVKFSAHFVPHLIPSNRKNRSKDKLSTILAQTTYAGISTYGRTWTKMVGCQQP